MKISPDEETYMRDLVIHTVCREISVDCDSENPVQPDSGILSVHCGVFVSLYVDRKLRGCIGTFSEEESLHTNLMRMAVSAATSDSRFSPIERSELDNLTCEISLLTPREQIFSKKEIVLGKHGIYIQSGSHRGTLLPQVAVQQNWSVEEFLGNCSKYKAGLGWDGWKSAEMYVYEAIVIRSGDHADPC
jgi:AmmeMemoRadiSam system protein A